MSFASSKLRCSGTADDRPIVNTTSAAPVDDPRQRRFLDVVAGLRSFVARGQLHLAEAIDRTADEINNSGVFEVVVPELAPPPKTAAERAWDSPGWTDAAADYHRNRRRA